MPTDPAGHFFEIRQNVGGFSGWWGFAPLADLVELDDDEEKDAQKKSPVLCCAE